MNILKRRKLEKLFKEIDEAKENMLLAESETEENIWKNLKLLAEMELSFIEIGG